MPQAHYTPEEVAARGEAIYAERIRATAETAHKGEFIVVDIETGNYEVDRDDLTATKRALATHPDAVLCGLRIGSPAAYRLRNLKQKRQRKGQEKRNEPPGVRSLVK
jgi:hypothetical protein